ncbi:hypothetical protein [Pantoea sp. Nvir]|uniref:hypothetical protein n=1 Tax=Pantoea sp. Nvir TaxID=2576760 RepID=UPI001358914E|nr:hypothetical protein [Pantoea sp. Nvir]
MPLLMSEVCFRDDILVIFSRLVPLLLGLLKCNIYLELLIKYHEALHHLIRMCIAIIK